MMEANRDAKYVCAVTFSVARFAGSEIKMRRDPGVARCALTPGYFLSPLRGENPATLCYPYAVKAI